MAMREFFTYQEVVDRLGAPEDVRQAILMWDLEAYIELNKVAAHSSDADSPPNSGVTELAAWRRSSRPRCMADPDVMYPSEDDYEEEVYYTLTGWFVMRPPDAVTIARSPGGNVRLTLYLAPAQNDDDGSAGLFAPAHFEVDYVTGLEKLWFRRGGIDNLLPSRQVDARATNDDTGPFGDQTKSKASLGDQESPDELSEGSMVDPTPRKPQEYEPSTYLPVIQALERSAKPSHRDLAGDVFKALRYLGFKDCDSKTTERLLETASEFKSTQATESFKYRRSTYLPVIQVLALLSGHSGRSDIKRTAGKLRPSGEGADNATAELRRGGYGPSDRTIWQLLKEARSFRP